VTQPINNFPFVLPSSVVHVPSIQSANKTIFYAALYVSEQLILLPRSLVSVFFRKQALQMMTASSPVKTTAPLRLINHLGQVTDPGLSAHEMVT